MLYKSSGNKLIADSTFVALTLMIAKSNPNDKDMMIKVIVNLYASNNALVHIKNNSIAISQKTDYPWSGKVAITVNPIKNSEFTLKMDVPEWAKNQVLPADLYSYATQSASKLSATINGEALENKNITDSLPLQEIGRRMKN